MNVTVGRVGDGVEGVRVVYVGRGRGSVLGNPLPVIGKGAWTAEAAHWTKALLESPDPQVQAAAARAWARRGFEQGEAAALYRHVLRVQCCSATPQRAAVLELARAVADGEALHLTCWCTPRPCHAEVIREAVVGYARRLGARE